MNNILYTHKTLWQDFEGDLPTEIEEIRGTETDGIRTRDLFFSGRRVGETRPRIFATLTGRDGEDALVIAVGPIGSVPNRERMALLQQSFSVMEVDYCGETKTARRTYYPEEISYANASVCGEEFWHAPQSAKQTPVYEWIAVCRYAVRAARDLGYRRIALYGEGEGGNLAIMTAALEEIVCVVSCYGCGWERYRQYFKHSDRPEPEATEEFARYVAGCEAENYARSVSCPVLYLSSSNNRDYPLDRAADTMSMLPDAVCSIAPRLAGAFGHDQTKNILPFLRAYLSEEGQKPKTPVFRTEVAGGELRCRILEPAEEIERSVFYYAFNEGNPAVRNWHEQETENGTCVIPVREGENVAFLYPMVWFKNGYCMSGKFTVTALDGVSKIRYTPGQILYVSAMGTDTFTSFCPDIRKAKEGEILTKCGPYGIFGVTDTRNRLATYEINEVREPVDTLTFDLCAKEAGTLYVKAYENYNTPRETCYLAEIRVMGGDLWQPVTLSCKQCKSETAGLQSFSKVNLLVFVTEGETLFNNLLWV